MTRCANGLWRLLAGLLILAPGGCASPITGLTEAAQTAQTIGHVQPSRRDTCETQRQIAAQSSRIDTIIAGKEVVYKADCQLPAQPKATS